MKTKLLALATVGAVLLASSANANLITNGDFETGDLTGWSTFTTINGTLGTSGVVPFNTTGAGASNSARFRVGQVSFTPTIHRGGGIFQNISVLSAGTLDLGVDIASYSPFHTNYSGGMVSLLLDGLVVASHDFGHITIGTTERSSLAATIAVTAGTHEVKILMTRPYIQTTATPQQYLDNVTALLTPDLPATVPPSQTAEVPEPGTLAVFGIGLAGLGWARRRRSMR